MSVREREREMAIMDSLRRFVAHEPVIAACCLLVGVNGNFFLLSNIPINAPMSKTLSKLY